MPAIKLTEYECRENLLPDICMFCGEPATEQRQRTFAWHPGWVWILILVNLIVVLIVALILTKKMSVRVPVCERHKGFWTRRALTLWVSFLLVAAFAIGVIIFMGNQGPGQDELTGWFCGGGVVLFLIWLIIAAVYSANGVRPTEITDRFIRLTGVDEEFIAALEDDRDRDREKEEEYRRERRARREAEERDRARDRPNRIDRRRDQNDDLDRRAQG